jgi:hypothetical protein
VSWHPHMSWLFKRLGDALGPLTMVPIPPELAVQTAPGKAQSQTWVGWLLRHSRVLFLVSLPGVRLRLVTRTILILGRVIDWCFDSVLTITGVSSIGVLTIPWGVLEPARAPYQIHVRRWWGACLQSLTNHLLTIVRFLLIVVAATNAGDGAWSWSQHRTAEPAAAAV